MKVHNIFERGYGALVWGMPVVAGLVLLPSQAKAQECETDADCGTGFKCYSETVYGGGADSDSATTGVGGSQGGGITVGSSSAGVAGGPAVCGDDWCMDGETWQTCPEDCGRWTYCGGAPCETDADCAQGYECGPGAVAGTTGGSSGGSGSVCGDGSCEADEDEENCSADCARTCQMFFQLCNEATECPEGYYCDHNQGVTTVTGSSSSGGEVFEEYYGVCALEGTSGGGVGGSAGASSGGAGGGGSNLTTVSSTVSGGTTGPAGVGGTSAANVSGSDGSTGDTGGHGHGHGSGGGAKGPWHHWRGCSIGDSQAPLGSLPFVSALGLGWVLLRRRQR